MKQLGIWMKGKQYIYYCGKLSCGNIERKHNKEIDRRDRINDFPGGCCDDSCEILAHHLQLFTRRKNGIYRDFHSDSTNNHAWLVIGDK